MTVAAAVSTASPVSALPAVQAASATGPGAGAADADTGFADALQQARQGDARSREAAAQHKATPKDGARERGAATREAAPSDQANDDTGETSAPDVRAATARPRNGTADDTDAGLPPWLAQALSRQPAAGDDAAGLDAGRSALAGQLAAAASSAPAAADTGGSTAGDAGDGQARPADTLEPAAARPAARTAASGLATAAAAAVAPTEQVEAGNEQAPHAGAEAGPGLGAVATATPLPQALAPAGPGFTLTATGEAAMVERPITAPVASPAFAPALGAELTLMVKEGVSEARLHLNPAEMGPITVQIVVEGQTARVEMTADHAATRQALEQAMPALAGALREDGLTLTGGGVFEQTRHQRQGGEGQASPRPGQAAPGGQQPAGADAAAAEHAGHRPATLARGGVDLYA